LVRLLRRPLSEIEAREAAAWRYPPPFDIYNADPDYPELFVTRTAAGEGYYPAVNEDGELVAFCVLGAEARVRGQAPATGTLDVGMGVHPDWTSQGVGTKLVTSMVGLAIATCAPHDLRSAVATFNTRSLALCRHAGFCTVRDFTGPAGRTFRELALPLNGPSVSLRNAVRS
jgi:ribosomal-protein-alanine N-acetyltransferase